LLESSLGENSLHLMGMHIMPCINCSVHWENNTNLYLKCLCSLPVSKILLYQLSSETGKGIY
jgi:hypothetical protein